MASEEPVSVVDTEPSGEAKAICFSDLQSRNVSRGVGNGSGVCRHTCACHPEVMDPCLWSRLSEHLVAHVLARLPMPQLLSLGWLSKAWLAISKTSSFKRMCAEAQSKTFGVLGLHSSSYQFQVAAFDLKERKWMYQELKRFPRAYLDRATIQPSSPGGLGGYVDALYAHDGGLVCFASTENLPIFVCNPLTNEWKTLPPLDLRWELPIMVQLVTNAGTGGYKVMVVYRRREVDYGISDPGIRNTGVCGSETAKVYDSKTGLWSTMNSGSVYGLHHKALNLPKVFDCKSRTLLTLCHHSCLKGTSLIDTTIAKGHVFALHTDVNCGNRYYAHGSVYQISELVSSVGNPGTLEILRRYESTLGSEYNNYTTLLFATDGFILLVTDNGEENSGEYHHQLVRLYDIARYEWHKLPVFNDIFTPETTASHVMCELRWDAFP